MSAVPSELRLGFAQAADALGVTVRGLGEF